MNSIKNDYNHLIIKEKEDFVKDEKKHELDKKRLKEDFKFHFNTYHEKYIVGKGETALKEANGKSIEHATLIFKSMDDCDRVKTAYNISTCARCLVLIFGSRAERRILRSKYLFKQWP